MMKKATIEKYLLKLSSKESMPGGGSVAALNGACGMALVLMVCNLSIGKEKYKKHEKLIRESIKKAIKMRERYLFLLEEDIRLFKNIEKVFKMKKETKKQKEQKKKAMEKACKICCRVPKEMIDLSEKGLKLVKKLMGKTNKSASSDLVVAKECFVSCKKSAYVNILINLKSINDKKFIKKYKKI